MVTGRTIERQVRSLDRQLDGLERAAIRRLDDGLRQAAIQLEQQIATLYRRALEEASGAGAAVAEARARVLLAQARALLTITNGTAAESTFGTLVREVHAASIESAVAALEPYQRQAVAATARLPVDTAVAATRVSTRLTEIGNTRVANAAARLAQHGDKAARAIERHITSGIIQGRGWRRTATDIRREVAITRRSAETIVRTESVIASDTARRDTFTETGVEYVQRIATQDSRVCPYCAARAGNVYRVGEAPAAIHPNDRCYNAPWRREWHELGLTDDAWASEHAEDTVQRLDGKPNSGAAPFEKAEGKQPPKAIWTPASGFTT